MGVRAFAMNVFYPIVPGKRLQLNSLVLTISLLTWDESGSARVDSGCAQHGSREDGLRSSCRVATQWGADLEKHPALSQGRETWRLIASFVKLLFMPAGKGQPAFHNSAHPNRSIFFG
jgi:hypothetical protein